MPLPNLATESNNLTNLALLYQMRNLMVPYVIGNMQLIGQAESAQVETFYNPNLFKIAVQFYGDITYWTVIAAANNLTTPYDPVITGLVSLLIPPKPQNNTGGVLMPLNNNTIVPQSLIPPP